MKTTIPIVENTRKVQKPLAELRSFLRESASRCRAMRWFGASFRISVAEDIAADVAKNESAAAREAYSAEQEDLAAEMEIAAARENLRSALGDGLLDDSDMPALLAAIDQLNRARAQVRRSARRDRNISDRFAHA